MAKNDQADKLYNLQAQQLAAQVANWAAQLDFQKERFRLLEMPQFQQGLQLEVDKFAWQKAEDTWKRSYQESLLTGMYQGKPTTQWLMDQARLTGSFNGERTLEGKLTDAQIQDMHDKMKLANDQFVSATTGYFNGQKTFDRQKFEAAQALEGWKFIATLSGPQNAFKQARAIASMPGGVNQMMQAFAGQYMLPSGGAVGSGGAGGNDPFGQLDDMLHGGMQAPPGTPAPGAPGGGGAAPPTAAPTPLPAYAPQWNTSMPVWYAQSTEANPGYSSPGVPASYYPTPPPGTAPGGTPPPSVQPVATSEVGVQGAPDLRTAQASGAGYLYSPPGAQAPVGAYNYSATNDGSVAVFPPGVVSPAQTADVSSHTPMNPGDVAPFVNQPYQYGGVVAPASAPANTPLPNQINAQNYNNAFDYQKQLLWAQYEDQGWDKGLAQEAYLRSLPKYGGPTKGAIAF